MVLEHFQKNSQAMQQLSGPIFEDKVIDFILEMAKVTDVVIDTDTLYEDSQDDAKSTNKSSKKVAQKPAAKKAVAKKPAAKKVAKKK
jgi:trigger factor